MLNALTAVFRLTTHQLLGGRRRYVTLIAFLLPVLLAVLARMILPREAFSVPTVGYAAVLVGVYAGVFVPFMAVYWGSAVLTDDIEGKTLVYLWTRPAGRARVLLMKFLAAFVWLVLLLVPSLLATYVVIFWNDQEGISLNHLQTVVWDGRALALGGLAYAGFAFFLSSLIKKPLMVSLLYVYTLDLFSAVLPGYLKLISMRHYVLTLTTQKEEASDSPLSRELLKLAADTPTTEAEALWTLIGVGLTLVVLGALILRTREFLGDDPSRSN